MPRGEGNGQGNFTHKGRNTKPMREVMEREMKAQKKKKRDLNLKKFLAYRERRLQNVG